MSRVRWFSLPVLARGGFILFAWLLLVSHAARLQPGPFGWQPLQLPAGWPEWRIGPLALLPLVCVLLVWPSVRPRLPRRRGVLLFNALLAGLTLLLLPWGRPEHAHLTAMLALFWFIYLFLQYGFGGRGEAAITLIAAGGLIVQGAVGVGQFLRQGDLGLRWLGELPLDPAVEGISVVAQNGDHLLRAYGISSHPNQYGLLLVVLLLIVWPAFVAAAIRKRLLLGGALLTGFLGLLVSFSRSGWLALLLGLLIYAAYGFHRRSQRRQCSPAAVYAPFVLLCLLSGLLFAGRYAPAVSGRFLRLDSPLELRSLQERQRDLAVAGELFTAHFLRGVGVNEYLPAAQAIDPQAGIVHNVPLLLAVERGAAGLALWLLWMISPWLGGLHAGMRGAPRATAVWCAMIVVSLVQPEPHLLLPKGAFLWGLAAFLWIGTEGAQDG